MKLVSKLISGSLTASVLEKYYQFYNQGKHFLTSHETKIFSYDVEDDDNPFTLTG